MKSNALKIVAKILLKNANAAIQLEYPQLERAASNTVKEHFEPRPPEFLKVMNMTKTWQWLLER